MEEIKTGDYVQYRTAGGAVVGYGIVVDITKRWHVLVDHQTGKRQYWPDTLMRKIVL